MKHLKTQQQLNEASENLNISDVSDSKMIIELEKKIQRLIDELNKINREADEGGNYKHLSDKYIWKMRVLKQTENRLRDLLK